MCIAVGYLCYFAELHAGISSPVAFGFGCVTGMLYGLFVFKDYHRWRLPIEDDAAAARSDALVALNCDDRGVEVEFDFMSILL